MRAALVLEPPGPLRPRSWFASEMALIQGDAALSPLAKSVLVLVYVDAERHGPGAHFAVSVARYAHVLHRSPFAVSRALTRTVKLHWLDEGPRHHRPDGATHRTFRLARCKP